MTDEDKKIMKNLIDIHTHTISSGHAYSTLQENVFEARRKGLIYYGVSDHASALPGGAHPYYFSNLKIIPQTIDGVRILKGAELNIMDSSGRVDLEDTDLIGLDYAIASLHLPCFKPDSIHNNTQAYLNVMKHPLVKVIGHPDDGHYPIDYSALVKAAKAEHVLLEVNNSSLSPNSFRVGARENYLTLLKICAEEKLPIILNTDAHISFQVGDIEQALEVVEQARFPYSLIVNYSHDLIQEYIIRPKPKHE